jgi:hypothetical protein
MAGGVFVLGEFVENGQRQAALIMIQSLQAQLAALMGVIGINPDINNAPMPRAPSAHKSQAEIDFLTEEEENKVEESLEAVRQEAQRESLSIQEQWAKQRKTLDEAETF